MKPLKYITEETLRRWVVMSQQPTKFPKWHFGNALHALKEIAAQREENGEEHGR